MKIEIPHNCPACEYHLELVNSQLFCRNSACTARLDKQIEHFAKTLGIKGMGSKTIEKLNLADITELYYLDRDEAISKLGSEKVVDKLLTEIEQSKSSDLSKVLASFSIPLIGNTAATKLCSVISSIDDITPETCKQAGLGEKATYNLTTWLDTVFIDLREFLPFSFKAQKNSVVQGCKTICITGKLKSYKTKAEAYAAIGSAGFKVVESVTKTTDYLVDEDDKQSAKRTKADTLGITIISNLISFIKENTND
jgi:DNA ligase (NAD+)